MTERRITPLDPEWPRCLNEIHPLGTPNQLYLDGLPLRCGPKTVAVVGTRRPTAAGVETTETLTKALVEAGFSIVSGLAVGIDAVAHRTAIRAGGYTIAVLGNGLDVPYPRRNGSLKEQIRRTGTLVTEYPSGTEPRSFNFPARNRIVAGLGVGVIVVEGGLKSGALITARLALDANRTVWAVPGSVRNPVAEGPNELIRTGQAALITDVRHILDELAPELVWGDRSSQGEGAAVPLSDEERAVLDVLDDTPVALEHVCRVTGFTPGRASLGATRLEVRGLAIRRGGGYEVSASGARLRSSLESTAP